VQPVVASKIIPGQLPLLPVSLHPPSEYLNNSLNYILSGSNDFDHSIQFDLPALKVTPSTPSKSSQAMQQNKAYISCSESSK